jgi:hypothetical protein
MLTLQVVGFINWLARFKTVGTNGAAGVKSFEWFTDGQFWWRRCRRQALFHVIKICVIHQRFRSFISGITVIITPQLER